MIKIEKLKEQPTPDYVYNQEVDLIVTDETDLGYKVIVNQAHQGLLYHNEVFRELENGDKIKGYVKEVREDGKIDVSMHKLGYEKVDGISQRILRILQQNGGYLPVHDKSDSEEIHILFNCSKKSFKQAIGALYKQKLIQLEPAGIRIVV